MNDWDDMNEDMQRLDETRVLDASNIRAVTGANKQNNRSQRDAEPLPAIDGVNQPLQDSVVMTFGDQSRSRHENFQNQLVDIDGGRPVNGLQNFSKLASVKITEFDWKYENFAFGYYQYVVCTELKTQAETITVGRRYTEFEELYKLLQLEHPGCIIPPIPPKAAVTKLKGKESDEARERKVGLTKFLQMLIQHPWLCQSPILESFLTDTSAEPFAMAKYIQQVDGQFSKAYLLDCTGVFQEEAAIGDFQSQGVSALFQQTNKVLKDKIWGSQRAQMGDAFGEFIEQAKDELSTFKRQEDYLGSLEQAYSGLIQSVSAQIQAQEETCQNLVEMANSFQKVRAMKGSENSPVTQAVCNISSPFNLAATKAREVAEHMRAEVLSIVVFDQSYLQEAKKTFLRWRSLVTRYYMLVNAVQSSCDQLRQMGSSAQAMSANTENQTRTAERDAIRDMMPAIKQTIIQEIELFQARFNQRTQLIIKRYTELHKQSASCQLQYWQDYLGQMQEK